MVYFIIATYLAITLLTGFIGYKKAKDTPEDYFMANRGLGSFVMFFTFIATNFSAFFFLGFAGEGYRIGYSYYAMMAFGTAFAALSFYLIGNKAWVLGKQNQYVTAPELIGDQSKSKALKIVYLLAMVFFTLPYMAVQPIGAGYIIETLTNGQIPYEVGSGVLTVFIVFYVFLGGMRSVAITDMIQGILMFILIFIALFTIADQFGGISAANLQVQEIRPELFSREGGGDYFTPQKWFSLMLLWIFCVPMFPQMFMRFYISKDLRTFKTSAILYSFVPTVLFLAPVMIGVFGHLSFPDLQGKAADQILPMMLTEHAPLWLAAVVMTGALAAFMSTLDSQLLALSTILTRDIYKSYVKPDADFRQQVFAAKISVVALALIALLIAYTKPATIFTIVKMSFTGLAVLFPATYAILHWKRANPIACLLSILLGESLFLLLFFGFIPRHYVFGFDDIIPVILLSSLVILVGSFINPKSPSS